MLTMKFNAARLLFLAICFCTTAITSHAQVQDTTMMRGRWSVEGRADKITDKISHKLALNKDQIRQIYAINLDIVRRMDEVKANSELTNKERMTQFKTLDTERSQRFKSVLTPTQFKKWTDWEMNKKDHLEAKMEKKRQRKANQ
ncbi:hypothetical protein DVR12_15890 [Chitinophaga silvatica]|uniref:LTXXQ motif family protein n=1 Tax=Chitinophaga silvatica TaxID=2282649 RepID=A0A3E1Y878_9BACT|nr:hypothetical protein [Chitinophaga silvatica]RFS21380.1 hypothetical protein DVR12_15890 [Chitinophaga silvatica]